MSVLTGLRNLLLRPRISNCCGCHGKDITVWSWEKDGEFFAKIQCDKCKREKTFSGGDSEDDIINYTITKWNDECNFWNYHERSARSHSNRVF